MSTQRPMPKQERTPDRASSTVGIADGTPSERRPYEAPVVTKKRSVARVTLFSGGGVTAGGLTASG